MRLTETMKEANKWLERKPSKFEKALHIVLIVFAAVLFMGGCTKMRTICDLIPSRPSRSAGKIAQQIDLRHKNKSLYVKMDRLAKIIIFTTQKSHSGVQSVSD